MTLQEKVHEHVASAYGETIRSEEGMRYDSRLEPHEINAFVDKQSTSWLLNVISFVMEDEEE